jgi:hypothetical protein
MSRWVYRYGCVISISLGSKSSIDTMERQSDDLYKLGDDGFQHCWMYDVDPAAADNSFLLAQKNQSKYEQHNIT